MAGDLDLGFSLDGRTNSTLNGRSIDNASSVVQQRDGKLLVAGSTRSSASVSNNDFAIMRFLSDGALDPSFSGDGKQTTSFGVDSRGSSVATQADGKIIVAGRSGTSIAVARYDSSGNLDGTFSGDGMLTLNMAANTQDEANSIVVQANGKILVAGTSIVRSSNGEFHSNLAVVRLNANGSLDESFGTNGKVSTAFAENAMVSKILAQSDGKFVVVGEIGVGTQNDFLVARFNPNGSLDSTYGTAGITRTNLAVASDGLHSDDDPFDASLLPNGSLVVTGASSFRRQFSMSRVRTGVVRYTEDGVLDTSFNGDGISLLTLPMDFYPTSIAVPSSGKILLAGSFSGDFQVVRLNVNGTLDSTFGSLGFTVTNIRPDQSGSDYVSDMLLQANGDIVVVGSSQNIQGLDDDFAVARYVNRFVAPVLSGISGQLSYTSGAAPIALIGASVGINDVDSSNFAGARLTVAISSGGNTNNRLLISGAFSVSASHELLYQGNRIGTVNSGAGVGTTSIQITFITNVPITVIRQFLMQLRFRTVDPLSPGLRTIAVRLTDGDGMVSNTQTIKVSVS